MKKFDDIKESLKRSRGTTYELFSFTSVSFKRDTSETILSLMISKELEKGKTLCLSLMVHSPI